MKKGLCIATECDLGSRSSSTPALTLRKIPLPSRARERLCHPRRAPAGVEGRAGAGNGGFNLEMWGTVVNRDGVVCAVAFTGETAAISGRAAA